MKMQFGTWNIFSDKSNSSCFQVSAILNCGQLWPDEKYQQQKSKCSKYIRMLPGTMAKLFPQPKQLLLSVATFNSGQNEHLEYN